MEKSPSRFKEKKKRRPADGESILDTFIRRIRHYVDIDQETLSAFDRISYQDRTYPSGKIIVSLNEPMDTVYIPVSGWCLRAKYLDDGRRQIINFLLPGDYFDLMSLVGTRSDHTISAATDCVIRQFKGSDFLGLIQSSPKLASAFWWVTVQEETILRQQIVRVGRMSAQERIANFILELNRRQSISDGRLSGFVPLPVPQAFLADALGLSVVHISRSLTTLKSKKLLDTSRRGIEILNRDGLMKIAEYNSALFEPNPVRLAAQ